MTQTAESIWKQYDKGADFKSQINLYDTVEQNENFFIGKQWEGVQANGLPTPVFNFIKRIILFLVASTATDNIKMSARPLSSSGADLRMIESLCAVVNAQYEALFEQNKMGKRIREFMRNAAVDGDSCIYSYFDPDVETGQSAKGAIRAEILDNTRVVFGNPNGREVQSQPYIIISRRELLDEVKAQAKENGKDPDSVQTDTDEANDSFDAIAGGKVTVLLYLWKDKETGTIHAIKSTRNMILKGEWDTEQKLYPITWMSWDYIKNCYHGQAAVTGLIPNQIFVNKLFAMTMISLMSTAYPKVVYDKTRIRSWSNAVGAAIGVNGGDVNNVARNMDPATISPQVSEFINLAIGLTKEFMGATDAALGDTRPDNTSAIIALQKASSVPMEMTKQNLFQCVEDIGNIWMDIMRSYYGTRYVDVDGKPAAVDFSILGDIPMSIKLDVGGSAYWSEIAQMNTLDNLLMQGKIDIIDYLERVPNGYISDQEKLIQTLKERQAMAIQPDSASGPVVDFDQPVNIEGGAGYGQLQRALNETGAEGLKLA